MTDQPSGFDTQPQMPHPAMPVYAQPAPLPRRGWGVFRALFIVFLVLGMFALLFVGGILGIAGMFVGSSEDRIEEHHFSGNASSQDKIAIVSVEDIIIDSSARRVIKQLKKARKDEHVKAVVLKVDSPGGTINASDHIHREVQKLIRDSESRKPVVVSMQGLAASGGYYISVPADAIYAEPTTMTGSIGVIASFPNVAGLMKRFDVQMEVIKTGPHKDAGSPFREMTEEERRRWSEIIGDAFDRFLEIVSEGRKMDRDKVKELATGEVYTAKEALQHGLIDGIGYLEDAVAAAEKKAGVTDAHVIEYKRPFHLSELLLGETAARKQAVQIDLESLLRANVPRVMYMTQGPTIGL
jgi:protease-4